MKMMYHGPQKYYINNLQRNISCICNLAAKKILRGAIYVIVIDAFLPWEQRHMQKLSLSRTCYVIVTVTRQEIIANLFFVCNAFVDDGNEPKSHSPKFFYVCNVFEGRGIWRVCVCFFFSGGFASCP